MCLQEVYTDEDMNRIVEELPEVAEGVVRLVKLVEEGEECWVGESQECKFASGINVNNNSVKIKAQDNKEYWSGYHFSIKRPDWPQKYLDRLTVTPHWITCLARKEWFTATGRQSCKIGNRWQTIYAEEMNVFVASQAFFPTYPETEAKLEDFLAYLEKAELEPALKE